MIDRLFFFPRKTNVHDCQQWVDSKMTLNVNQQHLQGWFVKAAADENAPVVIYYGGNAEDVSMQLCDLDEVYHSASLVLMNYRGFGNSSGRPTEQGILADALAVYDHLINVYHVNPNQIYLMGRSIGSSVAAYVASQRRVKGLILITPFDTIANVVPKFLRFFPLNRWLESYFNTSKYLEHVKGKFLVIAAGQDEVIPRECLNNLLAKFQDQVVLVEIPGADHQDINWFEEYSDTIRKYIS
jgi:pimeloyl-ACP methyl ester carboxylesterase